MEGTVGVYHTDSALSHCQLDQRLAKVPLYRWYVPLQLDKLVDLGSLCRYLPGQKLLQRCANNEGIGT